MIGTSGGSRRLRDDLSLPSQHPAPVTVSRVRRDQLGTTSPALKVVFASLDPPLCLSVSLVCDTSQRPRTPSLARTVPRCRGHRPPPANHVLLPRTQVWLSPAVPWWGSLGSVSHAV